jgi:hypothetical protein
MEKKKKKKNVISIKNWPHHQFLATYTQFRLKVNQRTNNVRF